ncbi:Glycosyltransferase involved in cell wall bisynthesis [Tenacibaculum sp. MAR_2010_89]|uniref:glycosyltransferase n=1 Tax=Tenacibaculum sp. MAR_2010_89 TaxID=1250198 RepID=UPI00089B3485|nr:glycosyltransferase [Tenacibaculum sp. MAR_2010_89]SEE38462.1 Glycosyltransferase involved in cell wall bisynthesis [Tenacibaculum sp. MAR_2010_89]
MSYIGMVVDASYPNDIRVRKEADALVAADKKVIVICPHRKNEVQIETINGVTVYRIGKNYSNFKKGILDIFESVFNVNPFFYFGIKKALIKYKIEYLHIHDLPLAGTGYLFKSRVKEIILDLHENYPEALKTWFSWKKNHLIKFKNFLFMNPKLWSKKERKYCLKYKNIICVVEEMKQKLVSNFDIDPSKLIVISNQEKKEFALNFKNEVLQNVINPDSFSITYVGGFGPHRGLDTAIKAMPEIVKSIKNAKLFLIGKGSTDVEEQLKNIVKENQMEKYVDFVGYRPFTEVSTIMKKSTVNIIPHKANEHTNNTIPHKLFQIMMSKSLLLVSSCKPLKRIVEKYDSGLVFKADDFNDFTKKILMIYKNKKLLEIKTENAYKAVMDEGENWDEESIKLVKFYNNL